MPHYADGTPAKSGDLVMRHQEYDNTDSLMIVTTINPSADSCNSQAIALATRQADGPWFPVGPQGAWCLTLKEAMRVDRPLPQFVN